MDKNHNLRQILNLTRGHNQYMEQRVDLIASNAWISQFVRLTMASSLPNNYSIGLPGNRLYGGCSYIDMLEREVNRLARTLFPMQHVVVQFLSGMQANIGAYNAVLNKGDTVISAQTRHGGHYSHGPAGPLSFYEPKIVPVPFDESRYNIDVDGLKTVFKRERPKLLITGWSEFLFAHPLAEIRSLCDEHGVYLMFDASHVAGLVAGGVFQPDATQYADIITSSTGKSLHAPDHGMLLFNDLTLQPKILEAVMPLLTSNTHPQEVAALGVAFSEMLEFGSDYARQVVRNSKALGSALQDEGVKVLYGEHGFSDSHTVLAEHSSPDTAVSLLDRAGLLCNGCELPWDGPGRATGLRLGTQAVTRRGMQEAEMQTIAKAMARILLHGDDPDQVSYTLIRPLSEQFKHTAFSFDIDFPLEEHWYNTPYERYSPETTLDTVRALIPFADCSTEELELVAGRMERYEIEPSTVVFEKGDQSDGVYFIDHGAVEAVEETEAGPRVVSRLEEGGHFGEMGVLSATPRSISVRTSANTVLLKMNAVEFHQTIWELAAVRAYFNKYVTSLQEKDRLRTMQASSET
jgi:glycine hydroxymethyltransferase